MNLQHALSRRSLLQRAAIASVIVAGASAMPITRLAVAQSGTRYVCTADGVRVRQNPGLAGTVLGFVNSGETVEFLGNSVDADGYTWLNISVIGRNLAGWSASTFFQRSGGATTWPAGTNVHVNTNDVNLRSGPGLGSSVIGNFDANTNAEVIGGPQTANGYDWYKIAIAGTSGWMASDFLSEGHVGQRDPFPVGSWVWTTTDVNLRAGAGTGTRIVATYGRHEAATILAEPQSANGFTWYSVEMASDGNVGWMAGEYLEYAPTEPTGSRLRVVDGPLNLRQDPDTSARILGTIPTGDVVVIRDASFVQNDGYTWANVYVERNPDLVGWVARDFTEVIG